MSLACLRSFFFPGLLASLSVLAGSYWLEPIVGLAPCALCLSQRLMLALYALVCLLALVHGPRRRGRRRYAWLAALCALAGVWLAGRQVWLQGEVLPPAGCPLPPGPLLDQPVGDVLGRLLLGGPDCVSISWSFLDLTLPEWSLLSFVLLAVPPVSWLLTYRFRQLVTA
ncbi:MULTISPECIES: disulfide bond formation protein B [Pseudomonas]|jgi:disulfide bond formation protein DsbB|uniref:Disulfide bond formation protein B n=1 Tax=Pseudomonas mosselii TaxID=78327 RepID=A0A5R8YUU8_9PSED|nr:disulfide bond formation protein B [Pseudomonas mosselii]TLP57250.1 disulfide bond formation protein B [Pseudomonas mosselii]